MKSAQQIVQEILAHIAQMGGAFSDWYVGIASDPKTRLFNEHNVNYDLDAWIYQECIDSDTARLIESHFIESLGCDGGSGGGDYTTKHIYAFRKGPNTRK